MSIKQRLIKLLTGIGLSRSEAEIYLMVNQNPDINFSELQKKTGYSLAQVYRAFEKLRVEGLVTSSYAEWRRGVKAVSLKALGEKLLKEQRKLGKIAAEIKSLNNLNELSKWSLREDPVQVLTDRNQIVEKCYQILAKPWTHMSVYGASQVLIDVIGAEPEHDFVNYRVKKGKSVNVAITSMDEYFREASSQNEFKLRNMRVNLDPGLEDSMVYIYDNEAVIWKKDAELGNRAIVIREPAMVGLQKNYFEQLWKGAK